MLEDVTDINHSEFNISRYRLSFQAETPVKLSAFSGITWRGALGHALLNKNKQLADYCQSCTSERLCAYHYIFETPTSINPGRLTKYPHAPKPYIIHAPLNPLQLGSGQETQIELSLIGKGNEYFYEVIQALTLAAKNIGKQHGQLRLLRVEQKSDSDAGNWNNLMYNEGLITPAKSVLKIPTLNKYEIMVNLSTPLMVKRCGKLVREYDFRFADLFSSLLRRSSLLLYFHHLRTLDENFFEISKDAVELSIEKPKLYWQDNKRYSGRQKKMIPISGIVGEFRLSGAMLKTFWPYLWLGQFMHAGNKTVMGYGEMRLS